MKSFSGGFSLVPISLVKTDLAEEATKKLYSIYGANTKAVSFEKFKEISKGKDFYCMIKNNHLVGALSLGKWGTNHLVLHEVWAAPSKDFVKANGMTAGKAMFSFAKESATKMGREFFTSAPVSVGEKFIQRMQGTFKKKPKEKPVRKIIRPKFT